MLNPYESKSAKLIEIKPQTDTIKLFRFDFALNFKPGQFVELSIPGYGEAPFAPCSAPGAKYLELCVRDAGRLTHKLHEMKIGDRVGIRGPYGNGWPIDKNRHSERSEESPANAGSNKLRDSSAPPRNDKKKNLLIVVGGLGLIPLRTLILGKNKFLGKDARVQIFYGAKNPNEMLFRYEYAKWRENGINVKLIVDKECANWVGCVGLVTTLFDKYPIAENATAFLCGPPIMYKSTLVKLKEKGFAEEDIFLSLERRMHCGLGECQHCAVGPYYTCKDGPVFCYKQLKNIPGAI